MTSHRFYDLPVLVDRLARGAPRRDRKVIFLVGAPLSSPELPAERGIPGVEGIIGLIRSELEKSAEAIERFNAEVDASKQKYQTAFELLIAYRGQDVANEIVRKAVLCARNTSVNPAAANLTSLADIEALSTLEDDIDGWYLPSGVRTLGKIIVAHPATFGNTVLTSNFDPLIEVSIRKSGGRYYRTVMHRDGDLRQTSAEGCHVVHFHGFWVDRDTLHTPGQLLQERPRLAQSLTYLIGNSTIVVVGYGGWDDVFTRALVDAVVSDSAKPDIVWTFFDSDEGKLVEDHKNILERLVPGIERGRVSLFKGIDCNSLLPRLFEVLTEERPSNSINIGTDVSSRLVEVTDTVSRTQRLELRIQLPIAEEFRPETDSPPQVDEWVGRTTELRLLEGAATPVAIITGIGGQGKSALAAYYVAHGNDKNSYDEWDWRDCKEEGDRIRTQLLRIISRVAAGLDTSQLDGLDLSALIDIFFGVLKDRRWLFVFDNADHYVDLSRGQFISGMGELFEAALSRSHKSRFIFTCRPEMITENPQVLNLRLSGLSREEARQLFRKRGVSGTDEQHISAAYDLTGGHPMWINIIAMQVVRIQRGLREVLDDILRGHGELPEKTLRSIWASLNDNQKTLLRTLGELERPEAEERVGEMVVSLPWNRFNKSLRTLKSLQLVVVKSRPGESELLELHPLVTQFVRKEFPRQDRERFISVIIDFLNRMIGRYKGLLSMEPSLAILDHWTQKVELEINRGHLQDAIITLDEVSRSLMKRGFGEELVRIGKKLFREMDWTEACVSYKCFDALLDNVVDTMIQLGQFDEAEDILGRYENAMPGKSAQFINLCNLRCYLNWFRGKFEAAITWGEEGDKLQQTSDVDTKFSTSHNLALARRDSGQIEMALSYFLHGQAEEEILDSTKLDKDRDGTFYGNIGRCWQLDGKIEQALIAYRKSAIILEEARHPNSILNRGYVRFWIAEALATQGNGELAAIFYEAAINLWREVSPPRARMAEEKRNLLADATSNLQCLKAMEEVEIERLVRSWTQS